MPLTTGACLGPYEIVSAIGAGGMGEVYKAHDPRLHRFVALKILAAEPAVDAERRRRFIQEAQAASALNHPNIITIYDVGSADGRDFMAMELVTGRPLDRLIGPHGLKVAEALKYAIQIADALACAHAAGIVHRDLKPANVMVTESGQVKVLDFGLAKLTEPAPAGLPDLTMSLGTRSIAGTIVGTVSYMSPEQAEGKPVDRRADIFSFGVMLYEMTTGQRPFDGESTMSTLASILQREPRAVTEMAPDLPRDLTRLIGRCLKKEVASRYQHMDDLQIALLDVQEDLQAGRIAPPAVAAPVRQTRIAALVTAGMLAGLALGAAATWWALERRRPPTPPVATPTLRRLTSDQGLTTQPSLSSDGKLLAYASDRATGDNLDIWVQQVAGGTAIRLTDDPSDDHEADFSPDGTKIAFRSDRQGGGIYVVSALGGPARLLARGGHYPRYSPSGGWIAYWSGEPGSGILSAAGEARMLIIPADGGVPRPLRPEFSVAFPPLWMPDGTHIIFWGLRKPGDAFDWWVTPIEAGEPIPTQLASVVGAETPGLTAAMTADFKLIFSKGGQIGTTGDPPRSSLWQVPLNPGTFHAAGRAELATFGTGLDSAPSVSRDGRVAFQSGVYTMDLWTMRLDAAGARVLGPPVQITRDQALDYRASVSADGRYVAFLSDRFGNRDLFLKDLVTGAEQALSASALPEVSTAISPDGTQVAYTIQLASGKDTVYIVPIGGGVPTPVCEDCGGQLDWTPNGKSLLALRRIEGKYCVFIVKPGEGFSGSVKHSVGNLFEPHVSPDGRWLAVAVNTGEGRSRIWFAPFKGDSASAESTWVPVTEEAGFADKQRFSPEGNWLYYYSKRDGFGCLYALRLDRGSGLPSGSPVEIMHFHSSRRSPANVSLGPLQIAVARDKLVFNMAEVTGNIWLLTSDATVPPAPAASRKP